MIIHEYSACPGALPTKRGCQVISKVLKSVAVNLLLCVSLIFCHKMYSCLSHIASLLLLDKTSSVEFSQDFSGVYHVSLRQAAFVCVTYFPPQNEFMFVSYCVCENCVCVFSVRGQCVVFLHVCVTVPLCQPAFEHWLVLWKALCVTHVLYSVLFCILNTGWCSRKLCITHRPGQPRRFVQQLKRFPAVLFQI